METKITIIVINRQCWFLAKTNISNHTLRNKNKFVVFWTKKILQHFFIIYSYYKYCYVRFLSYYKVSKITYFTNFESMLEKQQFLILDTLYYMKNLSFVTPYFLFTKDISIQPSHRSYCYKLQILVVTKT